MLKMKIMGLHLIRGKYTYAEEQGYVKSQAELWLTSYPQYNLL